jgi:xanthine dehydrogenase accessory factor
MSLADEVVERAGSLRGQGETFVVATVVRVDPPTSARPGDKAIITAEGRLWGWVGGSCSEDLVRREALIALQDGQPRLVKIAPESAPNHLPGVVSHVSTCPSAGSLDVFIDPQLPQPQLLVVGATPAAHTLIRLGAALGFRTCAVHPGALAADFPDADLVLDSLNLDRASVGRNTWAVVATMGHYDEDALAALLPHPLAYVGLVASRRRRQAVLELLQAQGVDGLDRIRRPADDAVAASQQEIALAVLSEIVAERRARQPSPMPMPQGPPLTAVDPVCGMTVTIAESLHTLKDGEASVFFCSAHCREAFKASLRPA